MYKEFCLVWTENLSASDKSSYIYNQEMWLEEPREERERRVWEPLKDTGRVDGRRGKRRRWRILWRIVATIERENDHVRRNARTKAQWSCLLSSLSAGRDLPRKHKLQSNKEVYCYPTACICDRTFSLGPWAECVAPSSRVSTCFPFAFRDRAIITWRGGLGNQKGVIGENHD